jgi:hypothetical protein
MIAPWREFKLFAAFNVVAIVVFAIVIRHNITEFGYLRHDVEKNHWVDAFMLALASQTTMGLISLSPTTALGNAIIGTQQILNLISRLALATRFLF